MSCFVRPFLLPPVLSPTVWPRPGAPWGLARTLTPASGTLASEDPHGRLRLIPLSLSPECEGKGREKRQPAPSCPERPFRPLPGSQGRQEAHEESVGTEEGPRGPLPPSRMGSGREGRPDEAPTCPALRVQWVASLDQSPAPGAKQPPPE